MPPKLEMDCPGIKHFPIGICLHRKVYFVPSITLNKTRPVNPDALSLSAVSLCNPLTIVEECQPCIRVNILLNATGLPLLHGVIIQTLEESINRFKSFEIIVKRGPTPETLWKIQYDCLRAKPRQNVHVSLLTVPDYGLRITKTFYQEDRNAKPDFQFTHNPERKEINVFIPQGPDAITRLCYQNRLCDPLPGNKTPKLNAMKNATLKYEYMLPCLCIEVYYDYTDSPRTPKCPFETNDACNGPHYWNVTWSHANNRMEMKFRSYCPLLPSASLCEKYNNTCNIISTVKMETQELLESRNRMVKVFALDRIEKDPHLCFKFTVQNRSHIKCPETRDWDVTEEMQISLVRLVVVSRVPANFSAVICKRNNSKAECDPRASIFNATKVNKAGAGEVHIFTFVRDTGSCFQVWRSDVQLAHKRLICPDYSHKHLGLISLASVLVIFTLVFLLFWIYRRICKVFTAPQWSRTVLLVYSPDSAEYKTLICTFADFLQSILGCEVILDMWDMNTVSQIGMTPWFYQKRELVAQRKGNIIIMWTKKSRTMYDQWRSRKLKSYEWTDPVNLFGAAMSCLMKDFDGEEDHLQDCTVVYFEGLCEKQDIPPSLRNISRFHLFKDLYQLLRKLQDTTCLSPPCLIKAATRYLKRRLVSSEKSKGLQQHVELYRQRLSQQCS
ncbi:hypothetical protein GDO86_007186 [Hymenochirus boettgeri]|uniref:SEFIR domain-containing protein n=1 Tax=Hymenochirus boettgeri TaxID=247094 RepID=A0A8T2ISS2_9PIPI|nr:hypothetical protein GDO86_007186 [Hymenochirus boettgeri]